MFVTVLSQIITNIETTLYRVPCRQGNDTGGSGRYRPVGTLNVSRAVQTTVGRMTLSRLVCYPPASTLSWPERCLLARFGEVPSALDGSA
jgi:hypothetical protein